MPKLCSAWSIGTSSRVDRTTFKTANAIGTIIAAVAVLLTQAEMKEVANNNPKMICWGFVPTNRIVSKAILRSRCQRAIPAAIKNPPKNRKIVPLAYSFKVSEEPMTPNIGNKTMGKSEVTAIGTASVNHQMAIQSTMPAHARPE